MRGLVGGYLVIGILFLLIGFFATGPCPEKNRDLVSNVVFVLGWPVYLYDSVVQGNIAAPDWLHRQTCGGGVVAYGNVSPASPAASSPAAPR